MGGKGHLGEVFSSVSVGRVVQQGDGKKMEERGSSEGGEVIEDD